MPYYLRHAPLWDDGSDTFPADVLALKWPLIAWLEAVLERDVEVTPTGASVRYGSNNWSKYKLLPYAPVCRFDVPIPGVGILVGLDQQSSEAALPPSPMIHSPNLLWVNPFIVEVGDGARAYWWARIPADTSWHPDRIRWLRTLGVLIRRIGR